MRITPFIIYDRLMNGFRLNLSNMSEIYDRISSGKKYSKPSDNALGLTKAMDFRVSIKSNEQFIENIGTASAQISYTEVLLDSASVSLLRVRELVMRASTGTESADSRSAIAEEVDNLRDHLLSLANTQYRGKYVFSGYRTDAPAFDNAGVYQGDSGVKEILVDWDTTMEVNIPGDQVFNYGGGSLFEMLDELTTALRANDVDGPTGIRVALDRLDAADTAITNTRADLGSRLNSLEKLQDRIEAGNLALKSHLSSVEDADFAESISDLSQAQVALQAMRESAGRILSQSLLDFLR